jgi:hypothetical protein
LCYPCVLFPSFDFNFIVDLRCGVSVSSRRLFIFVFLAVPVQVLPKGSVARSFFVSNFVCRATPSRAQDLVFLSCVFDLSSSTASVTGRRFLFIWACRQGPQAQGLTWVTSVGRPDSRMQLRFPAHVDLLCRSPNAPGSSLLSESSAAVLALLRHVMMLSISEQFFGPSLLLTILPSAGRCSCAVRLCAPSL